MGRSPSSIIVWIAPAAAVFLLNASLTFINVWPTPAITWRGGLSLEFNICVLALCIAGSRNRVHSRRLIAWISSVWVLLVLGRYADVTAPALYGRDINLYWDLRFIPDVVSMVTRVAPLWLVLAALAGIVLFVVILYAIVRWAWRRVIDMAEAAIHDAHRASVSAFVESPTFGGGSWLAHISLLSGIEVRDPDTNALLMTQRRDTMAKAFARRGYRTVAWMPGMRQRWPEGRFYGFDDIYGADRLAYRGPEFGWFAIPDQYSLDRLDAFEVNRPSRQPLFVFFPTIITHFPFGPTPPYQPDWRRITDRHPYDGPDIVRAYAREPNWTDFGPGYVDALSYDFTSIAGYVGAHADRDTVMIVLGDHQPPAAVSGEHASWDVPVHVIASRTAVLDRLVGH